MTPPQAKTCPVCRQPLPHSKPSRIRKYCSAACHTQDRATKRSHDAEELLFMLSCGVTLDDALAYVNWTPSGAHQWARRHGHEELLAAISPTSRSRRRKPAQARTGPTPTANPVLCPDCGQQVAADNTATLETIRAAEANHARYCGKGAPTPPRASCSGATSNTGRPGLLGEERTQHGHAPDHHTDQRDSASRS